MKNLSNYYFDFVEKIVSTVFFDGCKEVSAEYAQKLIDQQNPDGNWVYWNKTNLKRFPERENFLICISPIYDYKIGEKVKVMESFYNKNGLLAYVNTFQNEHFEYYLLRKHFDISNVFETPPKVFSTL